VTPCAGVLLVESRPDAAQLLADQLAGDGFRVDVARSAEHARVLMRATRPALVLLGTLDGRRGTLALLEEIRASTGDAWALEPATVVLHHAPCELDTLRAFEAGADDCLPADTGYLELRARLRALLRRTAGTRPGAQTLAVGVLAIDQRAHTVTLGGEPVDLRRLEFALLAHLAGEPGRVFSRGELLGSVWGYRTPGSTRTLESHVSRLRRKLAAVGDGRWVVNVRGVGYRLR
jgi:DNA-binding response OmpR family regulator